MEVIDQILDSPLKKFDSYYVPILTQIRDCILANSTKRASRDAEFETLRKAVSILQLVPAEVMKHCEFVRTSKNLRMTIAHSRNFKEHDSHTATPPTPEEIRVIEDTMRLIFKLFRTKKVDNVQLEHPVTTFSHNGQAVRIPQDDFIIYTITFHGGSSLVINLSPQQIHINFYNTLGPIKISQEVVLFDIFLEQNILISIIRLMINCCFFAGFDDNPIINPSENGE
jgi:hypothetical protein